MYQPNSTPDQKHSSYVKRFSIIAGSALEEAECFVSSLKTLQTSLNNNSNNPVVLESDLKSAMDQYVRLTMVCDVFKVFNPFKSPSPSPQPQQPPAAITAVPLNETPLIKEEPADIKPSVILNPPTPRIEDPRALVSSSSLLPGQREPMDITQNAIASSSNGLAIAPTPNIIHNTIPADPSRSTTETNNMNHINNNMNMNNKMDERRPPVANSSRTRSPPPRDRASPRHSNSPNMDSSSKDTGITIDKFITTFESLLSYFSNQNKLSKDTTWERLFIHSLSAEQRKWFLKNLQGKNYTWDAAKSRFLNEFGDPDRTRPDKSLARKTRYAQALLKLEMQDNDDLKEFNEKFKRYSDSAGMTCDTSLLKRYVNSLAKRFRELATPLVNNPDFTNDLYKLMQHVESLEQPAFGLVEVDTHCTHNWDVSTDFKSSWPTMSGSQKRRTSDHAFNDVEKRVKYQPVA